MKEGVQFFTVQIALCVVGHLASLAHSTQFWSTPNHCYSEKD